MTLESPTYSVAADNSNITGTIVFLSLEDGYYGKITLTNFPEGFVPTYSFTTAPIKEANYNLLKTESLKDAQAYLDNFTKEDFGILKAVPSRINFKIRGSVIDDKFQPIAGATVKDTLGNETISQTTGNFILEGSYESGSLFELQASAENYGSRSNIVPFNGPPNKTVKRNLGPIKLNPIQVDLQDDVAEELPLEDIQVKALKASKINFEMAQQQAMNQVITTAKTVLIPAILTQLAAFGITKASEAIKKNFKDINVTCPTNLEELNAAIAKKNRLVKQLNNIYKFLDRVRVGVQIVDGLISAAQIALPILLATPPPGSTAVASEKIERELKKYKLISSVTLMVLVILIQILERTLAYLALLDQSIGKCAIEGALPQEQLTTDLLTSTQFQSTQLSPVVTNVNGFEMSVIDVDNVTIDGLKRRRAVARNSQGIIMLQGEPSFSSNDQILIDELVFYIQQNDLKA
jgi:hypothetical protein